MAILKAGAVVLPAPVRINVNDELYWSSSTGRVASGDMTGKVIKEIKNATFEWSYLTESEYLKIKNNIKSGFFPITFHDDGADVTLTYYRGTLQKEILGDIGDGNFYYSSVVANIIQQ